MKDDKKGPEVSARAFYQRDPRTVGTQPIALVSSGISKISVPAGSLASTDITG
jgi:hypothetical protein